MHINELAKLGQEMREAQKRYFADRSRDNLDVAFRREREFDRVVAEILGASRQPVLFGDETAP